jgi:hypothetical protein
MPTPATPEDLAAAAEAAWLYTLPLIELAGARARGAAFGVPINVFAHMRYLADHRARAVTTPNNDTLYSSAQLDLSAGPITLEIPPSGARYVSLALMDAFTNNFAILGTRTLGPGGGRFRLIGPEEPGAGPGVVRCPTRHVWALARIFVEDEADLEAAREVQAGFSLQGPEIAQPPAPAKRSDDWRAYFASADALLSLNPPRATDLKLLRQIAPLGLGEGRFDPDAFTHAEGEAIAAGVARARDLARRGGLGGGRIIDGWSYPDADLGNFGENYPFRAQVAVSGLAALPLVEAMYMRAIGPDRGLFDGGEPWRLSFPAGALPPVNAFWSLSLYEATDDGQFFFTDNPLRRYALRNTSPSLRFGADGGLDIWISHEAPGGDLEGNWLPAPAGPFALFMRAYVPRAELLNGKWRLPKVERGVGEYVDTI